MAQTDYTIERLIGDLYRFCWLLDSDKVDNSPDFDSFSDLLISIEKNTVVKTKSAISHDLRLILEII